jgi:hypothetical protein
VALLLLTGAWLLVRRRFRPGTGRRIHWFSGLIALPVLAVFVASAIQMAHRHWWTPSPVWRTLASLHRARGIALPPLASLLIVALAASGLYLWYRGRDRRMGALVLAGGAVFGGLLIVWMRAG